MAATATVNGGVEQSSGYDIEKDAYLLKADGVETQTYINGTVDCQDVADIDKQVRFPLLLAGMNVKLESRVSTRYYGSEFMGHTRAEDIVEHFRACTKQLNIQHLLQISMDGPHVNWKVFDKIQAELKTNSDLSLINIGSCGLHILNGAFKHGVTASEWNINKLFCSLYTLFDKAPARREDYMQLTGSSTFPVKFCNHRWLENVKVAERALLIWEYVKVYVDSVMKKKAPNPGTSSFDTVKTACADVFCLTKMRFFLSVAQEIAPFLTLYQTDKPMLPFLCEDMTRLVRSLLKRYIKKQVLDEATNSYQLLRLDFSDSSNHVPYNKIDIGIAAEEQLKQLRLSLNKTVSDRQVMEFLMSCKAMLVTMVAKLLEKAPINYSLVRNLSCLDPRRMVAHKDDCTKDIKSILKTLANAHQINGGIVACDELQRQFVNFVDTTVVNHKITFSKFNPHEATSQIDHLLHETMGTESIYSKLWNQVVKKLLLLSHGQASVERGFSVNKEIETENLQQESLVAQRIIHDHILHVGGIIKVDLSKELLSSAACARQRYDAHLAQQRNDKLKEQDSKKRKCVLEEIEELKKKKKSVLDDIDSLLKSADEFAEKAEATCKISWITKSNSFRKTAKEKENLCQVINAQLDEKLKCLKDV